MKMKPSQVLIDAYRRVHDYENRWIVFPEDKSKKIFLSYMDEPERWDSMRSLMMTLRTNNDERVDEGTKGLALTIFHSPAYGYLQCASHTAGYLSVSDMNDHASESIFHNVWMTALFDALYNEDPEI